MSSSRTNGAAPAGGKRTLSLSMAGAEQSANAQHASTAPSAVAVQAGGAAGGKDSSGLHPLKHSWVFWFLNRHVGEKIASPSQYEESIKKVGGFASIESFWTIYSHLQSPSALLPVTDILLFTSLIRRPIWEEVPKGAKFTIRLRKGLADRLWEDTVLAAVGDQFDENDGVVGVVLSVRAQEDVISVWTEKSYTDGGARVKETIFRLLNLPPSTTVDYKLNSDLIQSTARPAPSDAPLRGGSHGGHNRHTGARRGEHGEPGSGRERSNGGHRRAPQQPMAAAEGAEGEGESRRV